MMTTQDPEGEKTWRGIIPALVTPLDDHGAFDEAAFERLIAHTVQHGVHGLSVLGSTGEGALLSEATQRRVVEAAVRRAAGLPVVVGVIAPSSGAVAELGRRAADAGADALLVTPPFYYQLDQWSVLRFYERMAADVPVPLFIYHIPPLTKVTLEIETVARLAGIPRVAGIKDSSGDLRFHEGILAATAGTAFAVFAGSGRLLAANVKGGGAGAIAASANLIPGEVVRLWDALRRGADDAVWRHRQVCDIEDACRRFPFPVNWKATLRGAGFGSDAAAFPLHTLTDEQRAQLVDAIRAVLDRDAGRETGR